MELYESRSGFGFSWKPFEDIELVLRTCWYGVYTEGDIDRGGDGSAETGTVT